MATASGWWWRSMYGRCSYHAWRSPLATDPQTAAAASELPVWACAAAAMAVLAGCQAPKGYFAAVGDRADGAAPVAAAVAPAAAAAAAAGGEAPSQLRRHARWWSAERGGGSPAALPHWPAVVASAAGPHATAALCFPVLAAARFAGCMAATLCHVPPAVRCACCLAAPAPVSVAALAESTSARTHRCSLLAEVCCVGCRGGHVPVPPLDAAPAAAPPAQTSRRPTQAAARRCVGRHGPRCPAHARGQCGRC
eukprot:363306-Chlamydomonas_euryale.AAC.1